MSYPSSVLNTNIASMIAQRNLAGAQQSLATSVERLSSGLRINRAKDDASGMAVATVINSQIKTSSVAYRNVNDAISMMQTAEGAMQEAGSMLLRIKELVTQGSNDSMSKEQYYFLVQEMGQLMGEVANTAGRTSFNGNNLLGNFSTSGSVATGTLEVSGLPSSGRTGPWTFMTGAGIDDKVTVELVPIFDSAESSSKVNNNKGYVDGALKVGALNALYTRIAWLSQNPKNSPNSGEGYRKFALAPGLSETDKMLTQKVYGAKNGITLGTSLTVAPGSSSTVSTSITVAAGVSTTVATTTTVFTSLAVAGSKFYNIPLTKTVNGKQVETGALATITIGAQGQIDSVEVTQSGKGFGDGSTSPANPIETLKVDVAKLFGVSGDTTTITYTATQLEKTELVDARNKSLNELIDDSLMQINSHRSYFGAFYGRFEHNIANLSAQTENLSAALSRVQDADYGAETATLTKVQILQQAATAMLAQANAMPNVILGLLKSS